jgi:hypothetical protein
VRAKQDARPAPVSLGRSERAPRVGQERYRHGCSPPGPHSFLGSDGRSLCKPQKTTTAEISYRVGGTDVALVVSKIPAQGDGRHAFVKGGSYHGATSSPGPCAARCIPSLRPTPG